MARLSVTGAWSAPITLAQDEFWQCAAGTVKISSEATPGDSDGIVLQRGQGIDLKSGAAVRVKSIHNIAASITREAL